MRTTIISLFLLFFVLLLAGIAGFLFMQNTDLLATIGSKDAQIEELTNTNRNLQNKVAELSNAEKTLQAKVDTALSYATVLDVFFDTARFVSGKTPISGAKNELELVANMVESAKRTGDPQMSTMIKSIDGRNPNQEQIIQELMFYTSHQTVLSLQATTSE